MKALPTTAASAPAEFVAPQRRMSGVGRMLDNGQIVPPKNPQQRGIVSYRDGGSVNGGGSAAASGTDDVNEKDMTNMPQMESPEERRERVRKENLRECWSICLFFVFLGFFTALILLEQSASSSRLAAHVRAKLDPGRGTVSLESVYDVPSLYVYMEEVLVPALYENSTDTNEAMQQTSILNPLDVSNRILGGVRVRQVRVKHEQDCQVGPLFQNYKVECYPVFTEGSESQASFGLDGKYQYTQDLTGPSWSGYYGSYNAHGFMELLPTNRTVALNKIAEMRTDGFLGAPTRALFIDFSVWNANVGTYAVATLVAEFGASGGVRTDVRILTIPQRALVPGGLGTAADWLGLGLILIVILFLAWFMFEEIQEIWKQKLGYLTDFWNILDWVNMALIFGGFACRLLLFSEASNANLGKEALVDMNSFNNLQSLAERAEMIKLLHAFNAVLLWGKVVKYLRHFPMIKNMIRAVWDAFDLFLPFLLMFSVAFVGFTMSYNIGFGDKLYELSTFGRAFIYLCRSFLRDVKLMPAYNITPMFGALLILIFYVSLVLVGVNVLFAILADAIFRAKYAQQDKKRGAGEDKDKYEAEPLQEIHRELSGRLRRFLKARFPWIYRRMYRKRRAKVRTGGVGGGGGPGGSNGLALGDGAVNGGQGQSVGGDNALALKDQRRTSSQADPLDLDDDALSASSYLSDEVPLPSREDLMRAIEHMSGRILSEVSIVGIEIKSELHDVCERVAQMQMAVDELSTRVEEVRAEQEAEGGA